MSSLKDTVNIRKALIEGFFMNAAEYQKENEYKTVRKRSLFNYILNNNTKFIYH